MIAIGDRLRIGGRPPVYLYFLFFTKSRVFRVGFPQKYVKSLIFLQRSYPARVPAAGVYDGLYLL